MLEIKNRDAIVGSIKEFLGRADDSVSQSPTAAAELEAWRVEIEKIATGPGLDFFDTRFEIVDLRQNE